MNTQVTSTQGNSVGLLNLESFELSQRIAKMLSSSTLVPEQYRATIQKKAGKDQYGNVQYREEPNPNGLSNCIIALNMANRMGADPLMVMQNLYLVNGRPSWSSQFIMAGINSSGRFSALRFELQDLGEKEIEYTETVWENRQKRNITKTLKVQDFSCVAWAIEKETGERLESSKITIEMAVKEGWYTKDGSKWQTMPEQMLRYRAASFFGRVYAPELLMGLRSAEEEQDRIIDVTPEAEPKVINASDFKHIKSLILKAKTLDELEEIESSIYALSDESERNELIKLWSANADKHKITNVEPVAPQAEQEPVIEEQPKSQTKKPTSLGVRNQYISEINTINSVAELNELHERFIIDDRLNGAQLSYLKDMYTQKKAELQAGKAEPNQFDKSLDVRNKLMSAIENAKSIDELQNSVAPQMGANKNNLTPEHINELRQAYASKTKLIEDQQDMFEDVEQASWIDLAIARIEQAKSQDDINAEYSDPACEELSDKDKQRLDLAAQKREAELLG